LPKGKYYYGEILLFNKSNNKKYSALTNLKGYYSFLNMEPGDYVLKEFKLNASGGNVNFSSKTEFNISIEVEANKITVFKTININNEVLPALKGQTDTVRITPMKTGIIREDNFDELKEYFAKIDNLKVWKDFVWDKEDISKIKSADAEQKILNEAKNWTVKKIDTFDDNNNKWQLGNGQNDYYTYTRKIENSIYRLEYQPKKLGYSYLLNSNFTSKNTFYLSVNTTWIYGSDNYGLLMAKVGNEKNKKNYCFFMINNKEQFSVLFYGADSKMNSVASLTYSNIINIDKPNNLFLTEKLIN
jgi:hypothetical protein